MSRISADAPEPWLRGSAFAGLRYVNRFLIVDGRVLELHILNELAEHRPR